MATDLEILKQFTEAILPELKAVSGRFAETVEAEFTETSVSITASEYITTLIDGRPPTSASASKGDPTLQQIILSWIPTKSIIPRASPSGVIPTVEQLSWMISNSIHKHGDLLYQRGGGNNIFEKVITEDRINNLLNLIGEKYFTEVNSINIPTITK